MKTILSPKVFFTLLTALIITAAVWFYLGTYIQKKIIYEKYGGVISSMTYETITGKCPRYGGAKKEEFLESYVVQKGDTLLTIAENQLGSSSRVYALVSANNDRYPELSVKNSFVEVGWKFYLPIKNVPPTFDAYSSIRIYGEVVEVGNNYAFLAYPESNLPLRIDFNNQILLPDKKIEKGDCLVATGVTNPEFYFTEVAFQ